MSDNSKKKKSTEKVEKNLVEENKSTKRVEKSLKTKEKSTNKVEKEEVAVEVVKKDNKEVELDTKTSKNSTFVQRLGAYLIDIFLISMVVSIIMIPFPVSDNYEKLNEESSEVIENYTSGKIDMNTYVNQVSDITYDLSREAGLTTIITLACYILYFIFYSISIL